MSNKSNLTGPTRPSVPTVKRLFSVSGNRCAFPNCDTAHVDPQTGSIVGEICHIHGQEPKSARYLFTQSNEERHGFDNLILMCGPHHKVVDDDPVAYTAERLVQLKKDHEARHTNPPQVDDATVERFATVAIENSVIHGSVVTTHGQSGGQTAHIIHNYGPPPADDQVRLEGKLETATGLEVLSSLGCPGLRLTVICRSARPAKIKAAYLCIVGKNFAEGFKQGFGPGLDFKPVEGSTETLGVELVPLSPRNHPEGFVLDRDDVCRFFYPLPQPPTTLALRAQPDQIWVEVKLFDGSEEILLRGDDIKHVLKMVFEMFKERPGQCPPVTYSVRVKTMEPPGPEMADLIGQLNQKYVPMAHPEPGSEGAGERPDSTQGQPPNYKIQVADL